MIKHALVTSHRGVEQLAAHQAHNLKVVGSSPSPATNCPQNADAISVFLMVAETDYTDLQVITKNLYRYFIAVAIALMVYTIFCLTKDN